MKRICVQLLLDITLEYKLGHLADDTVQIFILTAIFLICLSVYRTELINSQLRLWFTSSFGSIDCCLIQLFWKPLCVFINRFVYHYEKYPFSSFVRSFVLNTNWMLMVSLQLSWVSSVYFFHILLSPYLLLYISEQYSVKYFSSILIMSGMSFVHLLWVYYQ